MEKPQIIVLTPIKNESWILPLFLETVSTIADHIIIADQGSTDGSREYYKNYSKVIVIENRNPNYDEATRQNLLIQEARNRFGLGNILLCLDADEIPAANITQTLGWKQMMDSKLGTVFFIEKPNLYLSPYMTFRDFVPFAIGFKDDGALHTPKQVHSTRVPIPDYAIKLFLYDVFILHFALVQLDRQEAKMRFYSVKENILKTNPFWIRRRVYPPKMDWKSGKNLYPCPVEWYLGWEKMGIPINSISSTGRFWHLEEIILNFKEFGYKRFWFDNIWDKNWESIRAQMEKYDPRFKGFKINAPPLYMRFLLAILDWFYNSIRNLK